MDGACSTLVGATTQKRVSYLYTCGREKVKSHTVVYLFWKSTK